jgi:hypothetical protein
MNVVKVTAAVVLGAILYVIVDYRTGVPGETLWERALAKPVVFSLDSLESGWTPDFVQRAFHHLKHTCGAERTTNLGDFMCWAPVATYNAVSAKGVVFFFRRNRLSAVRVTFTAEHHPEILDMLRKKYGDFRMISERGDTYGNSIVGWTLPNGIVSINDRVGPKQEAILLWLERGKVLTDAIGFAPDVQVAAKQERPMEARPDQTPIETAAWGNTDTAGPKPGAAPMDAVWWERVRFDAGNRTVRGLVVGNLDPAWRLASELKAESIPSEGRVSGHDAAGQMRDNGLSFSINGDFNGDGKEDLAVVGVYEDSMGGRGKFLLVLTRSAGEPWQKAFLRSWSGEPGFLALTRERGAIILSSATGFLDRRALEWDRQDASYSLVAVEPTQAVAR